MVGPLKRYSRDPQGKGRGPGLYYHRGKGVYSKYSPWRDRVHSGKKPGKRRDYRRGKVGSGPMRQTHDKKTKRKKKRRK